LPSATILLSHKQQAKATSESILSALNFMLSALSPCNVSNLHMSKQTSIVKFKSKMDGISFYEQGGIAVARMAKGPGKERIMKDPAYQRTRESLSEYSHRGFYSRTSASANDGNVYRSLQPLSKILYQIIPRGH